MRNTLNEGVAPQTKETTPNTLYKMSRKNKRKNCIVQGLKALLLPRAEKLDKQKQLQGAELEAGYDVFVRVEGGTK